MSIFAKIAESPELQRQLTESKTKAPPRDFDGPDGNYVARFNGQRTAEKNGNTLCFFEYIITEGDYTDTRISRLFWFSGTGPSEITMDQLVKTCRALGVDVEGDMEKQLDVVRHNKTTFDVNIITDKKGYRSVHPVRLHTTTETTTETTDEWTEVTLVGKRVTCEEDECIVKTHDGDKLTLVNPDNTDEVWYEGVTIDEVKVVE